MAAVPIVLPDMDDPAETVQLAGWLVEVGEDLTAGDRVVSLLVPGVLFDVAAPAAGRLESITTPPGSLVRAGDVLGWVAPGRESGANGRG